MKNFILTESQLKNIIENLEDKASSVTITGSSIVQDKDFENLYYVNNPKIIDGGHGKFTFGDLNQLIGNSGTMVIEVGGDTIHINTVNCKNIKITKYGNLLIDKNCGEKKDNDTINIVNTPPKEVKIIGKSFKFSNNKNPVYFLNEPRYDQSIILTKRDLDELKNNKSIISIYVGEEHITNLDLSSCNITMIPNGGIMIPKDCITIPYEDKIKGSNDNFIEKLKILIKDKDFKKYFLYGNKKDFIGMFPIAQSKIENLTGYGELTNQKILKNTFNGIKLLDNGKHRIIGNNIKKISENKYEIINNRGLKFFIEKTQKGEYITNFKAFYDNNNEWHFINKINTNYSDLIDLLNDPYIKDNLIFNEYKSIEDFFVENELNIIKLISKMEQDHFLKFTNNSETNTYIGNKTESSVQKRLNNLGWTELWRADNGDILDMFFGFDIIGLSTDKKVQTVQVKTNLGDLGYLESQYKYADYFADADKIIARQFFII